MTLTIFAACVLQYGEKFSIKVKLYQNCHRGFSFMGSETHGERIGVRLASGQPWNIFVIRQKRYYLRFLCFLSKWIVDFFVLERAKSWLDNFHLMNLPHTPSDGTKVIDSDSVGVSGGIVDGGNAAVGGGLVEAKIAVRVGMRIGRAG